MVYYPKGDHFSGFGGKTTKPTGSKLSRARPVQSKSAQPSTTASAGKFGKPTREFDNTTPEAASSSSDNAFVARAKKTRSKSQEETRFSGGNSTFGGAVGNLMQAVSDKNTKDAADAATKSAAKADSRTQKDESGPGATTSGSSSDKSVGANVPKPAAPPKAPKASNTPPIPASKPKEVSGSDTETKPKFSSGNSVGEIKARSGPGRSPTGPGEPTPPKPKAPSFTQSDAQGSQFGERARLTRYSAMDRNK